MKLKTYIFLIFCTLAVNMSIGQSPHLKGTLDISIKEGKIKANILVTNIPRIDSSSIRLNAGLNIKSFLDSAGKNNFYANHFYDGEKTEEALQYYFPSDDNKYHFLPHAFQISYVGSFPVYADTTEMTEWGDWKGNIAFNSKTLRASEQSVWYPILTDLKNDKVYNNVSYDLIINCSDCKSIYINGSQPVEGTQKRFVSETPVPLLIYAGDFKIVKQNKTYFLNSHLTIPEIVEADKWIAKIKAFYEDKLKTPYGKDITIVEAEPVSKKNDWMFVTYPTIAINNRKAGLKSYFDAANPLKKPNFTPFIAHELGHYYFGSIVEPNSELRWMYLEGIAEYLSLQVVRNIMPDSFYNKKLQNYLKNIDTERDFTPLNKVQKISDINETYRYQYVPLLLTLLENQIGQEMMWKWLKYLLDNPKQKTNYDWFKKSLLDIGVKESVYLNFENTYMNDKNAVESVLTSFKQK